MWSYSWKSPSGKEDRSAAMFEKGGRMSFNTAGIQFLLRRCTSSLPEGEVNVSLAATAREERGWRRESWWNTLRHDGEDLHHLGELSGLGQVQRG